MSSRLHAAGSESMNAFVLAKSFEVLAGYLDGDEAAVSGAVIEQITAVVGELKGHAEGPFLGACYRAEDFLRTWQDRLPFGRPLAA